MKTKIFAGIIATSLLASPVQAQGIFNKIGKAIDDTIGAVLQILENLVFANVQDATPEKTCQPKADAQSLVDGQVYGENNEEQGFVCNNVKVKGLKGEEVDRWAEELTKLKAQNPNGGSTSYTYEDNKGRPKTVQIDLVEGGYRTSTREITVAQGVEFTTNEREFVDSGFYKVNVRSRLNLRSAIGAKASSTVTGQYKGGDIVEVISLENTTPDRCKSGQWALIRSRGAGVGYVCANYLVEAPAGTTRADVDQFVKPKTGGFGSGAGRSTFARTGLTGKSKSYRTRTSVTTTKKSGKRNKPSTSERDVFIGSSRVDDLG